MVAHPNAISDPWTVMVEFGYANIAAVAMLGPGWSEDVACSAISESEGSTHCHRRTYWFSCCVYCFCFVVISILITAIGSSNFLILNGRLFEIYWYGHLHGRGYGGQYPWICQSAYPQRYDGQEGKNGGGYDRNRMRGPLHGSGSHDFLVSMLMLVNIMILFQPVQMR